MGIVHTDIILKNVRDLFMAEEGIIKEHEIRQIKVNAMADTGTGTLVINEELRRQLGLNIRGLRKTTLANDSREICQLADPVEVHWQDRSMICQPLVISGSGEVLLGAIPLEDMDLLVDPVRQILTGAHGDEVVCMLKKTQFLIPHS